MGLAAWIVDHLLPKRPPASDADVDAAFAAASLARRQTTDDAQDAATVVQQARRAIEAERGRIQVRTEAAIRKRPKGQTSAVALAVEDTLRLSSFGGSGNDEG